MKLRIKGNSIRLRLLQSEVKKIAEREPVRESTALNNTEIYYELRQTDTDKFEANFFNNCLTVAVPANILQKWATSEEVGISAELENGLSLLIEKDFKCLTERRPDEDFDTFPNPLEGHTC
jgi:hypothetical protein